MSGREVKARVVLIGGIHGNPVVTKCQQKYCDGWPTHYIEIVIGSETYQFYLCDYHTEKFEERAG